MASDGFFPRLLPITRMQVLLNWMYFYRTGQHGVQTDKVEIAEILLLWIIFIL